MLIHWLHYKLRENSKLMPRIHAYSCSVLLQYTYIHFGWNV
jgi:hypothetical protein